MTALLILLVATTCILLGIRLERRSARRDVLAQVEEELELAFAKARHPAGLLSWEDE